MKLLLVTDEYYIEGDAQVLGMIEHVEHGLTTGSNSGYFFHGLKPEARIAISDMIYNNIEVPKPRFVASEDIRKGDAVSLQDTESGRKLAKILSFEKSR